MFRRPDRSLRYCTAVTFDELTGCSLLVSMVAPENDAAHDDRGGHAETEAEQPPKQFAETCCTPQNGTKNGEHDGKQEKAGRSQKRPRAAGLGRRRTAGRDGAVATRALGTR